MTELKPWMVDAVRNDCRISTLPGEVVEKYGMSPANVRYGIAAAIKAELATQEAPEAAPAGWVCSGNLPDASGLAAVLMWQTENEELGVDTPVFTRPPPAEEEERCERCTSLHDHFELAEEPGQVAHPHMADHPGGFCLVCGNLGAHPWHEEAPALAGLQEIEKYLANMGFRMVRTDTGDSDGD